MLYADTHCDISDSVLYCYPKKREQFEDFHPEEEGWLPHQVDIAKMAQAEAKILFWSICPVDFGEKIKISHRLEEIKKHIELYQFFLKRHADRFALITDKATLGDVYSTPGKIGVILHIEGMDFVQKKEDIHLLYAEGVRSFGLCGITSNQLAISGTEHPFDEQHLSPLGTEVIKELRTMKVIIDGAHLADGSLRDCIEQSQRPIMVSHTNMRTLCSNGQNLSDIQLQSIAKSNGLVGISLFPLLLTGSSAIVNDFLSHIEHALRFLSPEQICIGSDFDGMFPPVLDGGATMSDMQSILNAVEKKFGPALTRRIAFQNVYDFLLKQL